MKRTAACSVSVLLCLPSLAFAQTADVAVTDSAVADVAIAPAPAADAGATTPGPTRIGNCEQDALVAGHPVRLETSVSPRAPVVGERVLITYRLFHKPEDRLEFEPDPVAFAQPPIELEYARQQPDRDRTAHAASDGLVYGEITVAVQPFKTGEVTIASQLARLNAAGEVVRVCTPEVRFRVREPFGNDPNPRPRDLTPPEVVSQESYRWRYGALLADGVFLVALGTLLTSAWVRSRPVPVAPPPPPRPAWIVALEGLDALGKSDLLSRGQTKDYYDALSDIVRRYAGSTQGFDALEMTTDEVLSRLKLLPLKGVAPSEIEHLLRECDLVKFARHVPSLEESEQVLEQGYAIVRRSMPAEKVAKKAEASEQETKEPKKPAVSEATKTEDKDDKDKPETKKVDGSEGRRA